MSYTDDDDDEDDNDDEDDDDDNALPPLLLLLIAITFLLGSPATTQRYCTRFRHLLSNGNFIYFFFKKMTRN